MFKLAFVSTLVTVALAQDAAPKKNPIGELKKLLGPKCYEKTMTVAGTEKDLRFPGVAIHNILDQEEKKKMITKCKPENIIDPMCPTKEQAAAAASDETKLKEVTLQAMKCSAQCMMCKNFPDSLSGASTILMGATVALAGAYLF